MVTMLTLGDDICDACGDDVAPGVRLCAACSPVAQPVAPPPPPPPEPEPEIVIRCVVCADPACDETCEPEPVAPARNNRSSIDAMLNLAEVRSKCKPRINHNDLSRALNLAKPYAAEFTQSDCDRFNRLAAELPGLIREILYLQPAQDSRLDLRLAKRVDNARRGKVK